MDTTLKRTDMEILNYRYTLSEFIQPGQHRLIRVVRSRIEKTNKWSIENSKGRLSYTSTRVLQSAHA